MEQYDPIACSASQPPRDPKGKRFDDSEKHLPDENKRKCAIITHLRATDVVAGLRRIPAGFYVAIEVDGKTAKTSNKPPMVGEDVVEWDEEFSLPSERSCAVSFRVYASFELGARLGNGELLRQFKITVGELLDRSEQLRPIRFLVSRENEILPSCSSLRIIAERRICGFDESASMLELVEPDATTQLEELTDAGHRALTCYRQCQDQSYLDESITYLELARDTCPPDHPSLSSVLFNLATATFIRCQANPSDFDLDLPITLYQDALQLRPNGHLDHCATALDLSFALLARFQRQGHEADGTEAQNLLSEVLALSPVEGYSYRAAALALEVVEAPSSIQMIKLRISQTDHDSGESDDDKWIRRGRFMLTDPRWNSDRAVVLAGLGASLQDRFERTGNLDDIHESILMLEQLVDLTPDGHPDKPAQLSTLGISLSHRFERVGDLADINKSISMFEQAVHLTHDGHSDKPGWLSNLATSLSHRFERTGNLDDIHESILTLEQLVDLTPDGHPNKPNWLNNLGNWLSRRFEQVGDLADMNKSLSIFEQAVHLTPDGHPNKPNWLNNLGISLSRRFKRVDDLADINKAMLMFEQAVRLIPHGHLDEPTLLHNLGTSLLDRFNQVGELMDINKSISMHEQALYLIPDGHPDKPGWLSTLGSSLLSRFERVGELADINKSISMHEQVVRLTPDDHSNMPARLNDLGNSLLRRFQRMDDLADINRSISIHEQALDLTPDGHASKPGRLNNLAASLSRRFKRVGDLADINKSISMHEQAVDLIPHGHLDEPALLSNLGTSLSSRFEHVGELTDINKSISMRKQALDLTPDGHPDKPARLSALGNSLSSRFEHVGELTDINKSISMRKQALDLTPDDHPDKPARLSALGNSLSSRFEHVGELTDINKSISMHKQALDLTPDGHPDKPGRLTNLGRSLSSRFMRVGDIGDINTSISMHDQALDLTPDDHTDKPARLSALGNSLLVRFEWVGDLVDMNMSISMFEQAVYLTPDGHPDKPSRLSNLGNSLYRRFTQLGDLVDINKSISVHEQAVDLTPDDHTAKPAALNNLGNSLFEHFQQSHDPAHLSAATTHFSAAARSLTGSISTRLIASRHLISSANLGGDSETSLNAYHTSINLLPQLAWLGLPLIERHRLLRYTADIARDAAASALNTARPEVAVEWLEQGRSVVWNQFLQLRTPADELRMEHPDLADQFEQISRELEQAGSRQNSTSQQFLGRSGPETLSLELKETQRHHELVTMREKLLVQIRVLPGFNQFMLPKTTRQLAASAHSGPVVYLNASEQRCDALIVTQDAGTALHVPLLGIAYDRVESLQKDLYRLLRDKRLVASHDDMSSRLPPEETSAVVDLPSMFPGDGTDTTGGDRGVKPRRIGGYLPNDLFRLILQELWTKVVNPVLVALGFSTPPLCGEKKTRIFWCPTGPFAFLPIHAAGLYDSTGPGTKLSDFVISSYTPSLSALPPIPHIAASTTTSNVRLVAVRQPPSDGMTPLRLVPEEIHHIRTLSDISPFVTFQESCGTVEDVLEKMEASKSDWLHFACHGVQDSDNPLDSGLCLADRRRLKLSNIIQLSRPRSGLAFLSACQTARGDRVLSEESVHLAAGMLLAGYNGVIATMWSIMDNDAPKVAKDVYQYLFRDDKVPDSTEAAEALHYAVQHLRDSGASFFSWVPFIHVGL